MQYMHANIPYLLDFWRNLIVHLPLLKCSMGRFIWPFLFDELMCFLHLNKTQMKRFETWSMMNSMQPEQVLLRPQLCLTKNGLSLNDNKSNNKWNESFILFSPSFSSLNGSIVFCSRKRKLTVRTQCWDLHPTYYWLVNCFYYARYQWWWWRWRWLTRLWRSNRSAKVVPLWAVTLLLLRS